MPSWTTVLLAALLLAGAGGSTHAQTYPSATVKLIVPVPAGPTPWPVSWPSD